LKLIRLVTTGFKFSLVVVLFKDW